MNFEGRKSLFGKFSNKSGRKIWWNEIKFIPLHSQSSNGTLADRLGNGLQNRVEQFDSARYLKKSEMFV